MKVRTYPRTYSLTHSRYTEDVTGRKTERPRAGTRGRARACYTYCDIGVYFILLPIFTDESAAEFVHARRHYLKPLMALGEDGFERFDFLLKGVQTSHLRCDGRRGTYTADRRRSFTPSGTKYGQN